MRNGECEIIAAVRVEDTRPFLTRLIASLRCTPGLARVYGTDGTDGARVTITKIEITGGLSFETGDRKLES